MSQIIIQETNNEVVVLENAIGPQGPPGPPGTSSLGPVITITDDYLVTTEDDVILADATSQDISVVFPGATAMEGYRFNIKKIDGTSNTVTLLPSSGEDMDGSPEAVIYLQNVSLSVVSDGTAWRIL